MFNRKPLPKAYRRRQGRKAVLETYRRALAHGQRLEQLPDDEVVKFEYELLKSRRNDWKFLPAR